MITVNSTKTNSLMRARRAWAEFGAMFPLSCARTFVNLLFTDSKSKRKKVFDQSFHFTYLTTQRFARAGLTLCPVEKDFAQKNVVI